MVRVAVVWSARRRYTVNPNTGFLERAAIQGGKQPLSETALRHKIQKSRR